MSTQDDSVNSQAENFDVETDKQPKIEVQQLEVCQDLRFVNGKDACNRLCF